MAMKVEVRNDKLCIEIDLEKPTPSAYGKTLLVGSTRGNLFTTAMVDGKPVIVELQSPDRYFFVGMYFTKECLITKSNPAHPC